MVFGFVYHAFFHRKIHFFSQRQCKYGRLIIPSSLSFQRYIGTNTIASICFLGSSLHRCHCFFRIKPAYSRLLLYLKRYMDWRISPDKQKLLSLGKIVFFLMQSVQYSLLWSSNGLPHFLQDSSPIQITFFRQSSHVSFPTYITSSQTGHLEEIQCWITLFYFHKILSKNLSVSILTLFCPAYYKGFLKILNLFLMILTEKGMSFTHFSQIPIDESCMSDYNSIIKSINALKH